MHPRPTRPRLALTLALACSFAAAPAAHADEKKDLEQLRATTLGLIEALVGQGLLSRERADALLRQATPTASTAATAPAWGTPPPADAAARPVQRVPYLSETAKAQLREDIKLDVLAQAREENWADARQIPAWVKGVSLGGDLRVRWQTDSYAQGNVPADRYAAQSIAALAWSPDRRNTSIDRDRLTLRARLGAEAKLSDDTRAGLRLSTTGRSSTTGDASSSSQTLGNDFNRFDTVWDRAWLRWEPRQDVRVLAGRMPNPFYGTDLLWPDDVSLDGVALQAERTLASGLYAFATVGAFPLEEFNVGSGDKWLYALQIGADWAVAQATQWRIGLALYDFRRVEGVRESAPAPSGSQAGTVPYLTSQYRSSARLHGNTLINLNDPTSTAASTWGLASKFRPINLTTGLTFSQYDPVQVALSLDWVKNSAFDLADIRTRAGSNVVDGLQARTTGLQTRVVVGMPRVAEKGDWQAFAAIRRFQRDAWIDGLTDTAWNGGGTNYQGWQIGANYGFDRNGSIGLRLTSTRNLTNGDQGVLADNLSSAPLKIDTLQIELNARF